MTLSSDNTQMDLAAGLVFVMIIIYQVFMKDVREPATPSVDSVRFTLVFREEPLTHDELVTFVGTTWPFNFSIVNGTRLVGTTRLGTHERIKWSNPFKDLSLAGGYPEANSAGFDCQLGELDPTGFSKFRNNSSSASHADLRDREDEIGEDQFITQVLLERSYLWAPTDANVASPASIDTPWSVESPPGLYRAIWAGSSGNTVHIFDPAAPNGRYQSFDHLHFAGFREDLSSGYKTGIQINVETARQLSSFPTDVPSTPAEDDALQALLVPFLPFDELGTLTCEASDVAVSQTEELVVRIDGADFREIRPLAMRIESRSVPEGRDWTIWGDAPFPGEFTDDVGNDLTGLDRIRLTSSATIRIEL